MRGHGLSLYNWEEIKVIINAVAWIILLIATLWEKSKCSLVTFKGRYYKCFKLE